MNMFSDGKIKADKWGFEITSKTSENDFLSSEIKNDIHILVDNGDYKSYYTEPYEVYSKLFVFRVYFEKGLLVSITLSPAGKKPSWDNVEKDALLLDKANNDNWLKNQFSILAPTSFSWGTLESVLDLRGGSSTLVLRYKKDNNKDRHPNGTE